jgi:hypothetical protein
MKKILFVIIFLACYMTIQSVAMTSWEFQNVGIGDVVHLKLEWGGKTYLDGDSVVAFKSGDSAWITSTNQQNNFSGMFNCGFLTMVKSNQVSISTVLLQARITQLEGIIDALKKIIVAFIDQYGTVIKGY